MTKAGEVLYVQTVSCVRSLQQPFPDPVGLFCDQVSVVMWDPDDTGPSPPGCGHVRAWRCVAGCPQLLQPGWLLLQEEGVLRETHHWVSLVPLRLRVSVRTERCDHNSSLETHSDAGCEELSTRYHISWDGLSHQVWHWPDSTFVMWSQKVVCSDVFSDILSVAVYQKIDLVELLVYWQQVWWFDPWLLQSADQSGLGHWTLNYTCVWMLCCIENQEGTLYPGRCVVLLWSVTLLLCDSENSLWRVTLMLDGGHAWCLPLAPLI